MNRDVLEGAILDFLRDDPESFAILHSEIARSEVYPDDVDVDDVIEVLLDLVDRGWVVMRHPEDPTDEYWKEAKEQYLRWLRRARPGTLFQEYGPWFELTKRGLDEAPKA